MNAAPQNDGPLLVAQGLSKSFGATPIIQHVDLIVDRGKIITVIGPNGSGKTTLLKLILGLEKQDQGQVTYAPDLAVGYVPQTLVIEPILPITVKWFLELSANGRNIEEIAREMGISHLYGQKMQSLSGGELQRVMLARALLCHPNLLVLDEPAQGVDVNGQAELYNLISQVKKRHNISVLMVSHDLHLVMSATDHVICLNHHVCCSGHPHSVRDDPAFTALFGSHVAASLAVYTHHHDHQH